MVARVIQRNNLTRENLCHPRHTCITGVSRVIQVAYHPGNHVITDNIIRVGVYISSLEYYRKMKFRTYLNLILISNFLCCHGRVILWCVVQAFIFGAVGIISKV